MSVKMAASHTEDTTGKSILFVMSNVHRMTFKMQRVLPESRSKTKQARRYFYAGGQEKTRTSKKIIFLLKTMST
jgi:hypothetical protein